MRRVRAQRHLSICAGAADAGVTETREGTSNAGTSVLEGMIMRGTLAKAWLGALSALALGALPSDALAQREWKVREELRLQDSTRPSSQRPVVDRVAIGRDGTIYGASPNGDVVIFDHTGKPLRTIRLRTPEDITSTLRERVKGMMEQMPPVGPGHTFYRRGSRSEMAPSIGWIGDTLWVIDRWSRSVTLLDRGGRTLGSIPYDSTVAGMPADPPLALLADGSLLRTSTPREPVYPRPRSVVPAPPGNYRMPVIPLPAPRGSDASEQGYLMRVTPAGRVVQGLEIFLPSAKEVAIANPYGQTVIVPRPFQDSPLIVVTTGGSEVVVVERYRPVAPDRASHEIARFDVKSGKRTAHRYAYTPAWSAAAVDSAAHAMVDDADSPFPERFILGFASRDAAKAAVRAALNPGDYHAPISDAVAGADHTVWLREQPSGRWIVLDREGAVLGYLVLPGVSRILHTDAENIWAALDRNPNDARSTVVVRYRIVKP